VKSFFFINGGSHQKRYSSISIGRATQQQPLIH
jgi:hypothetical protein